MVAFNKIIAFWATLVVVYDLSAMTQAVRKSPAVTRTALVAARTGTESLATARTGVARSGISRTSLVTAESPMRARSKPLMTVPKYNTPAVKYMPSAREQAKKFVQNPKVIAAALGAAGVAIGLSTLIEAEEVAKTAHEQFDPAIFDKELTADEFVDAIVMICNVKGLGEKPTVTGRGTGFIVRSKQTPGVCFVITAAHCVTNEQKQFIIIRSWGEESQAGANIIELVPIIVDHENDVAVLLIPQDGIKKFESHFKKMIPAIPASQLSDLKPRENEIVEIQGYPGFIRPDVPGIYRKEFVTGMSLGWYLPGVSSMSLFHNKEEKRDLAGVSGGPMITMQGKQAKVVGIVTSQLPPNQQGTLISAGMGKLPRYLANAEKVKREKDKQAKILAEFLSKSF